MKIASASYETITMGEYEGVEMAVLKHKHGFTLAINVNTDSPPAEAGDTLAFIRKDSKHNHYVLQESMFLHYKTLPEVVAALGRQTAGH